MGCRDASSSIEASKVLKNALGEAIVGDRSWHVQRTLLQPLLRLQIEPIFGQIT